MAKDKWGYDPDYDGESPDVDDEDMIAQLQAGARSGGLKPPPNNKGCVILIAAPVAILSLLYTAVEYLA